MPGTNTSEEEAPAATERVKLIRQIEKVRGSRVLAYICGDRQGPTTQIGDDAVRPMYDLLRALGGKVEKLDLFLYSRGGDVDVPWRIVTMIREFCERFAVLVPYRANSAATLIALGADEIVMGKKGELGPIDPILNKVTPGEGGSLKQEQLNVEDIMGYMSFVRQRAELTDQAVVAGALQQLAGELGPVLLGNIFRLHSHIRAVARKMLGVRKPAVDQQVINVIVETLAERTYAHGHAIGREEAKTIGLPIADPDDQIEDLMWSLLVHYEKDLHLREPIDPEVYLQGKDEHVERVVCAVLESTDLTHEFSGEFVVKAQRATPPQLTLNLQVNLQLPAGFDPSQIPPDVGAFLQAMVNQAQQAALQQVQDALRQQAPLIGFAAKLRGARWPVEAGA